MVSIIITTYGDPTTLRRAIESVLNQTYKDFEILVVDDNSPETKNRKKTEKLMEDFRDELRIQYIKHSKNRNGAAARNTGIKVAKGKYIGFLDNDDFFVPTKLEKCINLLEKNPDTNIILTNVLVFRNNKLNAMLDFSKQNYSAFDLMKNINILGTGSNLFLTKQLCMNLDGFDEGFIRHQDIEFMVRALEIGTVKVIPQFLTVKVHTGNNIPDYHNLKNVKKQFTNKFDYIIKKQSEEDKKQYFINMMSNLFDVSVASGNREYIREALLDLKKTGKVSLKQRLFVMAPKLRDYIYILNSARKEKVLRLEYNRKISGLDCEFIKKMIALDTRVNIKSQA